MSKISKKNATLIASLYNRIFVAEMMLRDSKINPESYKMWRQNAVMSAQELDDKFGIKVIGY